MIQVAQDTNKEILKFLKKKIENDETWAEAFGKLVGLDEADQNEAIRSMLESINGSMRWGE